MLATSSNLSPSQTTEQLIAMWLHKKSVNSRDSYSRVVRSLVGFIDKPVQRWQETLTGSDNTLKTKAAIAKSFIGFCFKIGAIPFNLSMAVATPKAKDCLQQRILTESDVLTAIALEASPRNKLILKTLYYGGLRASELVGLNWSDLTPNGDSGQLTVFGKGGKTRSVKLPRKLYRELTAYRGVTPLNFPIFGSATTGDRLTRFGIIKIVKAAGQKAGLPEQFSPHWLRHAHASHSIDRGAPLSTIQATLGHSSVSTTSRYLHAKPNESSGLWLVD